MAPIETRPGRFSDRGSAAVLIVAICLSVAGLGAAFILRQHKEKDYRSTQADTRTFLVEPGVKAFEVISKISEPKAPLWAAAANKVPSTGVGGSTGTYPAANLDNGNRASNISARPIPDHGAGSYTPLSASVSLGPESTAWVPVISFAPIAPRAEVSANADATPSLPQLPAPAATSSTGTGTTAAVPAQPSATASVNRAAAEPPPIECGSVKCAPGLVCCNASCGTCARPGEKCSQQVCGMSAAPTSTSCGLSTCNVGEFCCNPYCGICATSQAECDSTATCMSPVQYPQSVSCGMVTCNTGYVCCNPSCGICAPYGEPCSQETCS